MGGKKVFELMLEIGHKSSPLNKKLTNGYTHKWTAYVKGVNNSNIEHCIQRVVFQLHDSFDNPYREVSEAPFQVKETGYAGFEMPIQIYFKNRDKPNHIVFVYDLSLLASKPNDSSTVERLKFINPNREFEKCLIKSGAQLLSVSVKKERSDSPPAKKHKSSSLIPSKDMSKLAQSQTDQQQKPHAHQHHHHHQQQQQQQQQQLSHTQPAHQNHHHHHKSSHQNHHSNSSGSSQQAKQHAQPKSHGAPQKSSSKDFIDFFGAPLVYNSQPNGKEQSAPCKPNEQFAYDLQLIQAKISCLSDCDRLQRIVDIIEESGEWFNLTPKKFEFDLKRLDKRTLIKIEKCLQH